MKQKLILIFFVVAAAMLPSQEWLSNNVLNPILWALAVCLSLEFIADSFRWHIVQDPQFTPEKMPMKADDRLALTPSPSYAARWRNGQESVELCVPTGDFDNPRCWHGLDLATAKRLRNELCEAVDHLEALLDLRKYNAENVGLEGSADSVTPQR